MTNNGSLNLPEYHEKSELQSSEGYYPNLSFKQSTALEELRGLLELSSLDIEREGNDEEYFDLKLLRFLRARSFNVNKAYEMFKEDVEWRVKMELSSFRKQSS